MPPLACPAPAAGAALLGVGAARPRRVVSNADLALRMDTSDEWIRTRTGIVNRRVAGDGESVVDLAAEAGAKALANAGVQPGQVDLILVATSTMDFAMPQAAPQVAGRLGSQAGGYDVGAACAGFCYALAAAADAIRAGSARTVLVIGSDRMTDILDPADRGTVPIFGDAAGAVVVGAAPSNGVGPLVAASDGDRSGLIAKAPDAPVLAMDGPAVFRWATTQLAPYALRACADAGIEVADLAGLVAHQANLRIIDALARALKLPAEAVVARDIIESGNTSAASIPLALDALLAADAVPSGGPLLLIGFGSGLSVAAQVVLCP
ncbi:MAG TPA: beta-ketoacyl-ACP synthase 3 [Mycobacteriales bacterium]|nr:beta-ketoacyl-ACP synthase 3 [Mycobacteriales bacterium]